MLGQMPLQLKTSALPAIPLPYASSRWAVLLAAYIGYAMLTLVGGLAGVSLQAVDAGLFILLLAGRYGSRVFPLRKNLLNLALLFSFLLPLAPLLLGTVTLGEESVNYLVKYYAVYFIVLLCLPLRLPPLYESKLRAPLFFAILMLLLTGMLLTYTGADASDRMQGLFTNPNNFALMAMGLLFVLNDERDAWYVRWGVYGLVGGLILLSGTAGALLSVLAALGYRLIAAGRGHKMLVALLAAAGLLAVLAAAMLLLRDQAFMRTELVSNITAKFEVAYNNLELVFSDRTVNFYQASRGYDEGATSALWRLVHWKETFRTWRDGGWLCVLFGNGLGSSVPMMGILPHNDYLRFLFELGLLGLLANALVWGALFRQMLPANRWLLVMMAIYGFSENNFDNFLAMALLVFFSISSRQPIHVLGRRLLDTYRQMAVRCTERTRHLEPAVEG